MTGGLGFTTLMKGLYKRNTELLNHTRKYKDKKNHLKYKKSNKNLRLKKLSEKERVKFSESFKLKIRKENQKIFVIRGLVILGVIIILHLLFSY